MTVFLQIPIARPTGGGQVLRFSIGIIVIQMVRPQNMQSYVGIFRPPAILTPIVGTYFGKLCHLAKEIDPSLIPGLEKTVYLFPGGQPLLTDFPSPELARLYIASHPPVGPSTVPAASRMVINSDTLGSLVTPPPPNPLSRSQERGKWSASGDASLLRAAFHRKDVLVYYITNSCLLTNQTFDGKILSETPKWRNRQTRCVQGAVGISPCGFKSHLRHHPWSQVSTHWPGICLLLPASSI
jgi:hypothetical protein